MNDLVSALIQTMRVAVKGGEKGGGWSQRAQSRPLHNQFQLIHRGRGTVCPDRSSASPTPPYADETRQVLSGRITEAHSHCRLLRYRAPGPPLLFHSLNHVHGAREFSIPGLELFNHP